MRRAVLGIALVATVAVSAAAAAPSATISSKLVGRWSRRITTAQWSRYHVSLPAGTWRLVVKRSGIVEVVAPHEKTTSFYSRFKTSRSRLNIGVIPFCTAAVDSYKWTRRTGRMIVRRVSDNCGARTALFAGTWRKT